MKLLFVTVLSILLLPGIILSQLSFDPPIDRDGIEFEDTPVNEAAEFRVTVTCQPQQNAGQQVRISNNNDVFDADPRQVRMNPNERREFVFTFEPDEEQEYNDQYVITAGGENGRIFMYRARVSGNGAEGRAEVFIDQIGEEVLFLVEDEDELPSAELVVQNSGNDIGSFSADYEADWLLVDPLRGDVEPDQEVELTISMTEDFPRENGEYEEIVTFHLDHPDEDEVELSVTLRVHILEIGEQVIPLEEGWNMVSANRDLIDLGQGVPSMEELLEDVIDDIMIIKDGVGRFCVPRFDFWGIDQWNTADGYQIRVRNDTELVISGQQIPYDRPIELNHGWNLIAYYPSYELFFHEAFRELAEDSILVLVKNGRGRFWAPAFGQFGEIEITPNEGLQALVTEDAAFSYPRQPERVNTIPQTPMIDFQHFPEPINTSQGMSVLFTEITGMQIVGGAEVACITPEGVVAGAWVIDADSADQRFGMGVWKDDPDTEVSEGFEEEGDPLRFLYWDPVHDWELDLVIDVVQGDGTMDEAVYQTDGLLVIGSEVSVSADYPIYPHSFTVSGLYPNPFNSTSEVEFNLNRAERVTVSLHELSGRLLRSYSDRLYSQGSHRLSLRFDDLPTGVYLLSLQTAEVRKVVRAVLIR